MMSISSKHWTLIGFNHLIKDLEWNQKILNQKLELLNQELTIQQTFLKTKYLFLVVMEELVIKDHHIMMFISLIVKPQSGLKLRFKEELHPKQEEDIVQWF